MKAPAVPRATPVAGAGTHVGADGSATGEAGAPVGEAGSREASADASRVAGTGTHVGGGGNADRSREGRKGRAGGTRSSAAATPPGDLPAVDVLCVESFGVRVTRRPDPPSLGRRARERQIAELHAQLARDADALDEIAGEAAQLVGWRRDADELVGELDAWLAGDPGAERAGLESDLAAAELALHGCDDRLRAAQARTAAARRRRDGLRRLLGDAALLDPPDHAVRAA